MRSVFDSVDLEIIDQVYEAAWAHLQASQPDRDTGSDGNRQDALRKKIFGVARVVGSGHVDFDTLSEVAGDDTKRSTRVGHRQKRGPFRNHWLKVAKAADDGKRLHPTPRICAESFLACRACACWCLAHPGARRPTIRR
jgi:hypothetical protein